MKNKKKMTAALAAVIQYIKSEEEAAIMASGGLAAMNGQMAAGNNPHVSFKPWGMSGRQTQMQMRNLMQLRALRTAR